MQEEQERLFDRMCRGRGRLIAMLDGLSEAQLVQPGVIGEWSVRDVLAHITLWDEVCMAAINAIMDGQEWAAPHEMDHWNPTEQQKRKDRPLDQVMSEFGTAFRALCAVLMDLPEERFRSDPKLREWTKESLVHYLEHSTDIVEWRLQKRGMSLREKA